MEGSNDKLDLILTKCFDDKFHWQLLMVFLCAVGSMHTCTFQVASNFYRVEVPYYCVDWTYGNDDNSTESQTVGNDRKVHYTNYPSSCLIIIPPPPPTPPANSHNTE